MVLSHRVIITEAAPFSTILLAPLPAAGYTIGLMSEYIEIEPENTDDPDVLLFHTNLVLAPEGAETYDSVQALEEGSPVAQALAYVEGIRHLRLGEREIRLTRDPDVPWHVIVADVSAALKDFFL